MTQEQLREFIGIPEDDEDMKPPAEYFALKKEVRAKQAEVRALRKKWWSDHKDLEFILEKAKKQVSSGAAGEAARHQPHQPQYVSAGHQPYGSEAAGVGAQLLLGQVDALGHGGVGPLSATSLGQATVATAVSGRSRSKFSSNHSDSAPRSGEGLNLAGLRVGSGEGRQRPPVLVGRRGGRRVESKERQPDMNLMVGALRTLGTDPSALMHPRQKFAATQALVAGRGAPRAATALPLDFALRGNHL
eukprot:SRR837773.809.p2 GENE.SRR837773.809~~SRR837773.809.p2  ORF type:complete len:270 (-),score=113.75 SRR837773.809:77-814(-)